MLAANVGAGGIRICGLVQGPRRVHATRNGASSTRRGTALPVTGPRPAGLPRAYLFGEATKAGLASIMHQLDGMCASVCIGASCSTHARSCVK